MRDFCPRCETPIATNAPLCPACGYRVMIPCPTCGRPNVPQAMFCGGCGGGMHLATRLRRRWEAMVSLPMRSRLKNLGGGFLFGTALALFAFGSMGMSRPELLQVQPQWAPSRVESPFTSREAQTTFSSLGEWKAAQDGARPATMGDLVKVGDLLLQGCPPIADETPEARGGPAEARHFLPSGGARAHGLVDAPLRRAEAAMFFYRLAADRLALTAPEETTYRFADIPRYHSLNVPAELLETIGIRIAREPEVFGGEDHLTLGELSEVATDFLKAYEDRLKMKAFSSLDPAS